jgi:hypothetical protein
VGATAEAAGVRHRHVCLDAGYGCRGEHGLPGGPGSSSVSSPIPVKRKLRRGLQHRKPTVPRQPLPWRRVCASGSSSPTRRLARLTACGFESG